MKKRSQRRKRRVEAPYNFDGYLVAALMLLVFPLSLSPLGQHRLIPPSVDGRPQASEATNLSEERLSEAKVSHSYADIWIYSGDSDASVARDHCAVAGGVFSDCLPSTCTEVEGGPAICSLDCRLGCTFAKRNKAPRAPEVVEEPVLEEPARVFPIEILVSDIDELSQPVAETLLLSFGYEVSSFEGGDLLLTAKSQAELDQLSSFLGGNPLFSNFRVLD